MALNPPAVPALTRMSGFSARQMPYAVRDAGTVPTQSTPKAADFPFVTTCTFAPCTSPEKTNAGIGPGSGLSLALTSFRCSTSGAASASMAMITAIVRTGAMSGAADACESTRRGGRARGSVSEAHVFRCSRFSPPGGAPLAVLIATGALLQSARHTSECTPVQAKRFESSLLRPPARPLPLLRAHRDVPPPPIDATVRGRPPPQTVHRLELRRRDARHRISPEQIQRGDDQRAADAVKRPGRVLDRTQRSRRRRRASVRVVRRRGHVRQQSRRVIVRLDDVQVRQARRAMHRDAAGALLGSALAAVFHPRVFLAEIARVEVKVRRVQRDEPRPRPRLDRVAPLQAIPEREAPALVHVPVEVHVKPELVAFGVRRQQPPRRVYRRLLRGVGRVVAPVQVLAQGVAPVVPSERAVGVQTRDDIEDVGVARGGGAGVVDAE
eukprot:31280-Pelagococcus_subviridis.AAC.12